jgi:hypothetical protein
MGISRKIQVSILTNRMDPGENYWSSSSRIRGAWVAKYLSKLGVWDVSFEDWSTAKKADVVLFQKLYLSKQARDTARQVVASGSVVIFDLCDPEWLDPRKVAPLEEMLCYSTLAVGSSPIITSILAQRIKAFTIPDGVDLQEHPHRKEHQETSKLKVVWFGNKSNWDVIAGRKKEVEAAGHELITISDHPDTTIKWTLETENQDILMGDVFWDPRGRGWERECKTNNKELKAWALGLPVFHEENFAVGIERFDTKEKREAEAAYRLGVIKKFWSMEVIIKQWDAVLRAAISLGRPR